MGSPKAVLLIWLPKSLLLLHSLVKAKVLLRGNSSGKTSMSSSTCHSTNWMRTYRDNQPVPTPMVALQRFQAVRRQHIEDEAIRTLNRKIRTGNDVWRTGKMYDISTKWMAGHGGLGWYNMLKKGGFLGQWIGLLLPPRLVGNLPIYKWNGLIIPGTKASHLVHSSYQPPPFSFQRRSAKLWRHR